MTRLVSGTRPPYLSAADRQAITIALQTQFAAWSERHMRRCDGLAVRRGGSPGRRGGSRGRANM